MPKNQLIKFFLVLSLLILGLAGFGYLKATPFEKQSEGKGPKIVVEPSSWDFGEVRRPEIVEHEFAVKNVGSETLEIKRVSTSCGCTTAKIEKGKIAPAETAELVVRYDSGAMVHEKGEIERIVYIKSNDPINPGLEVKIYANVY